jgi:CheY-like chemotaxis protein
MAENLWLCFQDGKNSAILKAMSRRQTILVVEDDEELRRLYRHALQMAGYDVQEARGGFEALRRLDTNPPDLIILDLMLPGMDGFTVRSELAAHAQNRNIPIVVVTGSKENHDKLDVNCILRKPVTEEYLLEVVRRCLASPSRAAT